MKKPLWTHASMSFNHIRHVMNRPLHCFWSQWMWGWPLLGFPPFFSPQYCSCSVYFLNMFVFIPPCQCSWAAQATDCLSRVGKGLNIFTPDTDLRSDPNSLSSLNSKKNKNKKFQMLWRSLVCVYDMCDIAEAALLNLKMNYFWEQV